MGWQQIRDGIDAYMSSLIGAAYDAQQANLRDAAITAISRGVWDELIAATGTGTRHVLPDDWAGSAYAVEPVVGASVRVLRRKQVNQPESPATLSVGDPGTGRAWQNSGNFVSGTISAGTASIVTAQTTSNYFGATQTALAWRLQTATTLSIQQSRRIVVAARVGLTASATGTTAGICFRTASLVRRVGIERTGGGYRVEWYTSSSGSGATLTNNPCWLALVLSDTRTDVFYNDTASTTFPTSGWTNAHSNSSSPFSTSDSVDLALCMIGVGSGGNFTTTLSHVYLGYAEEVAAEDDQLSIWPTTLIMSVEQPIEAVTTKDVASLELSITDDLELSDAEIRASLYSGLLCSFGWTQNVEARWKRGASPSGSWAEVSAQTSEGGSSGSYYIEVRPQTTGQMLAVQALTFRPEAV